MRISHLAVRAGVVPGSANPFVRAYFADGSTSLRVRTPGAIR